MRDIFTPRQSSGRLPVIVLGDSNAAQGYVHASAYPVNLQNTQRIAQWAYHLYCHQGEGHPATTVTQDTIVQLGPFTATSVLRGTWVLDLGIGLTERGIASTCLAWAIGSTTLDYYNPTVSPVTYASMLAWVQARLASMPGHQDPIVVLYEGTNGEGSKSWEIGCADVMAGLRADLSYPSLQLVVMRCPYTLGNSFGEYSATITKQNAYVASDQNSFIAYCDDATYVDNTTLVPGQLHGNHVDMESGRRWAVGLPSTTNRSVLDAIRRALAAR